MDPYAELKYSLYKNDIYKLDLKIKLNKLTTMNFASFIDDFTNILEEKKNKNLEKFIMVFDMNNIDYNINTSQVNEVTNLFKKYKNVFKEKLLGTFIIADNNVITIFINIFKNIYTPMKPLFLNTDIDNVIENLVNNIDTNKEYKL